MVDLQDRIPGYGPFTGATPIFTLSGQAQGPSNNTSVVGIRETDGPTDLTVGGIADGEFLQRSGGNLVGVAGVAPSGPAGGDLSGTYPNPEVAALTETTGPTQLVVGAIADGQFLQRSAGTLIGVAGVTPSGPAGGDLSGTYPNPAVAALTETSGPTQLVVGAIADGELVQRVAGTLVGISGALPADWDHDGPNAGASANSSTFVNAASLTFAVPLGQTWKVSWSITLELDAGSNDGDFRIRNTTDGTNLTDEVSQSENTSANELFWSGFTFITGAVASKTYALQFNAPGVGNNESRDASLSVERVI